MDNSLNNFESQIKNTLENFSVPYDSDDWGVLEKSLAGSARFSNWKWMYSALFIGVLGASIWYFGTGEEVQTSQAETTAPNEFPRTSNEYEPEAGVDQNFSGANAPNGAMLNKGNNEHTTLHKSSGDSREPHHRPGNSNDGNNFGARTSTNMKLSKSGQEKTTPGEIAETTNEETPLISAEFTTNVTEGCVGLTVQFQLEHGEAPGVYLWNFGDGTFSNEPNPVHRFSKSGIFDISLSVTSLIDGKIHSNTIKDMIKIHGVPKAAFDWNADNGGMKQINFTNMTKKATDSRWKFGDSNGSYEINPSHAYTSNGDYTVELIVNNSHCADTVARVITVK